MQYSVIATVLILGVEKIYINYADGFWLSTAICSNTDCYDDIFGGIIIEFKQLILLIT